MIHGLAIAGSIAEYGFSPWALAATILGFNLGIELMQLAIVAVTIPWLILLARTKCYSPVRIIGAAFGWVFQRAFGWSNPVEPLVTALAAHPLWPVGALAALAPLATPPSNTVVSYTGGAFQFSIGGIVGSDYIIQASTNLTSWETLSTTNWHPHQ